MPLEPITTRLEKIFELSSTVRTFRLRFPQGRFPQNRSVVFKAGQFCLVQIPQEGKILKKPYSICSAPFETGSIDLCIKLVDGGYATNWFWNLKEGSEVVVTIPYGGFLMKQPVDYDPIFIATGTGLAPLRSMIKTLYHDRLLAPGREVWLIFGVRYEDEVLYDEEWRALERGQKGFHYIPTISRPKGWKGEVGYVQEKLKKFITDPKGKEIYVCGLIPMIEAVQKAASEIGFDPKKVHFEKYV